MSYQEIKLKRTDQYLSTLDHLAIIPDGNRRWAKAQGLSVSEGHSEAFLNVGPSLLHQAWCEGIHTTTLWLFSTDNWNRSDKEINHLMCLYEVFLVKMYGFAKNLGVKMIHLGRKDRIPKGLLHCLSDIEGKTKLYANLTFNFGLDYGGMDEIQRAVNVMATIQRDDGMDLNLSDFLDTAGQRYPNPNLIIRTSGEKRTSGFMPVQSLHAEYVFINKYFPDLVYEDISYSIEQYHKREKRYGY